MADDRLAAAPIWSSRQSVDGKAVHKVLVVDDDHFAQKLIKKALGAKYEIISAENGQEGYLRAIDCSPQAILLDVEMPVKNGYETCELLKANPATDKIPVIFLSGNSSLREKMLGFERGAEDYLVKPFDAELLVAKVGLAVEHYLETQALGKQISTVQGAVFEALTVSAELGRALRFVEHTFAISDFEGLAKAFFKSMEEYGLSTSVMFVTLRGNLFFSHTGAEVPPLEKELLQTMHGQGRFIDFGCRTFCNFRQVASLIKNMPLDDRERYGRIKDTVPFILGSVDGKIRSIDLYNSLISQTKALGDSILAVSDTLDGIGSSVEQGHAAITQIMRRLMADLDARMPQLGLEEDQEKYLVGRIDQSFQEVLVELDSKVHLGNSLAGVVRLLQYIQSQHEKMVEGTSEKPESAADLPNDGELLSTDVEFF